MSQFLRTLKATIALQEMRLFWFAFPLVVALVVVDLIYLPPVFAFIGVGLTLVLGTLLFFGLGRRAQVAIGSRIEQNELKNIIFALDDALLAYDQNFQILFFNPAAEKLFTLKASAALGKTITPKDAENPGRRLLTQVVFPSLAPAMVTRTKAGQYPQVVDLSFSNPSLELRVTTSPISGEKGELFGFMKIIRDRTHEFNLIRSKSEFITVASHQLRTPINEISWAIEVVGKEKNLGDESRELLTSAIASARKLSNLVEDLLNISKIEEGRFGYALEETDALEFLGKILADIMPQAERAGLKLYFDRPKEPLPKVRIDSQKLRMVMANLLDNAIRYNVENGQIIVGVKQRENEPFLEVRVKDTGIGIPPEEIKEIFTKFFRASNALKFQTEGSGLDLYIAQNIIQGHGGQMWAESELNRGTTFYFTLPTDPTLVPQKEVPLAY